MLDLKRASAGHDTLARGLGLTLCNIGIRHFIMDGISWLYQIQRLFIICSPGTDVTDDSHGDCSLTAGHKKTPKKPKF